MEDQPADAQVAPGAVRDIALLETGFALILSGLGLDWRTDPHLQGTPERAARAWYHEIFGGITGPPPSVTTFPFENDSGMVILRSIPVRSVCAHHLLPFIGHATVGYITGDGCILGLSKLSRITNYYCRRPQVQEELTRQIAQDLWKRISTEQSGGVGVVIKANHMCMQLRGVNHEGEMITSHLLGEFRDPEVRAEFLNLAGVG